MREETKPIAELQHITHDFVIPGRNEAARILNDISLQINTGDTIAITGPSGSGKTTLLNILGTILTPTSGNVLIENENSGNLTPEKLALLRNRTIGFVLQKHLLLPQLTVLENVLLPLLPVFDSQFKMEAGKRAETMLKTVGLETMMNQFPGKMSVGECQRVAVVRALINQPELVLADEPTGALDAKNAGILVNMLLALQAESGFALMMVTHDPVIAGKMKKEYRLRNGVLELIS